jgi:hypothetical protein
MIRKVSYTLTGTELPDRQRSGPYTLLISRQDPTVIGSLSFGSIPTHSNKIYEFVAPLPWINSVLLKKYI